MIEKTQRNLFHAQVKSFLTPALKAQGFRPSGTTYRRVIGDVIHIIHLQGSRDGGQCCVCLGIHLSFLPTVGLNAQCRPEKITEPECEFRTRLTSDGEQDYWWTYGNCEKEANESVISLLQTYLRRGAPYFDRFSNFPTDFTKVTISTPEEDLEHLFPRSTSVRRDLALARIHTRLGDKATANLFASRGLANAGPAISLKRELLSFLSQD